jgi:hypothetical protein
MLATWWVLRWHQVSVFRIRMPRVSKEESFESLSLTESSNDDENENNDSVCKCSKFNKCHVSPCGWLRMARAYVEGLLSPKLQTRPLSLPDG